MTEEPPKPSVSSTDGPPRSALLLLLLICLAGVAVVVYLVMRPAEEMQETIISVVDVESPADVDLNVLDVIDTLETPDVQAVQGQRYKVLVVDEAREGASGIARIGGLVTFVPGTQRGDVVVIEVTRLRRTTADATVVERVASDVPVPGRPDRAPPPERPVSEMVGQIYRGTITDVGQEGDGVTHVDGKVVFVEGAARGEHVEFRIVEDMGRFARAEVVSKSPTPFDERPAPQPVPDVDEDSMVGQVFRGTVREMGRQGDGIVRVNGKVVFVEGAQMGQHVEFRVVEDRGRYARAVIVSVSDEPYEPVPAVEPRPVRAPEPQRDRVEVEVGNEFVVTVTDRDRRRPNVNGVARINGLVVFVPDTQPGDRVRIRITERRPRSANAMVLERLPSEDNADD